MRAPRAKRPLGSGNARLRRYNELMEQVKRLVKGDDEGLRALIDAAVAGPLSDLQLESVVSAAARSAGVKEKSANDLVKAAREDLKRKEAATPQAKEEKKRRDEAEAKAAEITLWESCRDTAESKTLVADMRNVVHRLGVVREDEAIAGAYLACASRLLKRQAISYLRRGAAASGKNHLITVVLKLFPRDCVIPISSATPMALIYYRGEGADIDSEEGDENALAHKIIVVAEAAVLSRKANGDEHPLTGMLRVLLSDGKLDHHIPLPSSKGGTPKTVHIKRNGPIVLLMTSAREDVEAEMLTRLLSSDADESGEQTHNVITNILKPVLRPVDEGEVAKWVDFQRWLERGAPYEVAIPFLGSISDAYTQLVKAFPATLQLRMRRDVSALVAAVEASAVVHRAQRKTDKAGRIIAELDDYLHAQGAFNEGMASLYDLRPAEVIKATLDAVIAIAEGVENADVADPDLYREYDSEKSYRITVEAVRKKLGVASKETAAQRLEKLIDFGFLEEDEFKRGKGRGSPRFYKILAKASGARAPNVFPHPDDVAKFHGKGEGVKTAVQKGQDVRDAASPIDASRTSSSSCTADSHPSALPRFSKGNGAEKRENARKCGPSARERIDGARGAGAIFSLWQDGAGFDMDLRLVGDRVLSDTLLAVVDTHYADLLAELKREREGPDAR
jgi:hypothetical protein